MRLANATTVHESSIARSIESSPLGFNAFFALENPINCRGFSPLTGCSQTVWEDPNRRARSLVSTVLIHGKFLAQAGRDGLSGKISIANECIIAYSLIQRRPFSGNCARSGPDGFSRDAAGLRCFCSIGYTYRVIAMRSRLTAPKSCPRCRLTEVCASTRRFSITLLPRPPAPRFN